MSRPIILFGTGELAAVAHFYLTRDGGRRVAAATVDGAYLREPRFEDLPVIAFEEIERAYSPADHDFFVALSYSDLNRLRARKCQEARAKGYELISYVSSKATVWPGFAAGPNAFILEDNTIQPFARIGSNVTLWSGNHIGHHAVIEDDCFLASHIVVSGGVTIEQGCFIGVNVTLRDHIRVGRYSVVGAGSLLLADAPEYSVFRAEPTPRAKVPSTRLRHI
jgi:sugar O-acyltransferase (sialic acid O-acetyltransferase NeuD family)